ncbi:MAG: helicase-related protein [Coriobacteriia bacterium]|nr:helicase-related protein [Coriobacteriia bacterium]
MERGGQVYYISNRVRTINDAANRVGLSAGEARIGVVHGRMKKDQIETVMEDFSAGKFDVLVSTTIIENGIDNPNTNTLIIEDSERLGLSQMYQLKGRVGRSVEQAYAYFMVRNPNILTQESVERLKAIDEFTDLGSGMQIAMRDLEIRGAGNFLGAEQSGNLSHVGFDLFAQMLKSAVENTQNYESYNKQDTQDYLEPSISDVAVNIPGSAFLSNEVIPEIEKRVM